MNIDDALNNRVHALRTKFEKFAVWPLSRNEPDSRQQLFSSVEDPEALKEYIRSRLGPEGKGFSSQTRDIQKLREQAASELSSLDFQNLEELDRKLNLVHEVGSNLGFSPDEMDAETQLALIHMLSQKSGLTPETVMLVLKEEGSQASEDPLLRSIYPSDVREEYLGFPVSPLKNDK